MPEHAMTVAGPERSVAAFRRELLNDLAAAGVPEGTVEISAPKPASRPITEPEPLGHIEWVMLGISIAKSVVTAGLTELVKDLIKKQLASHRLKAHETSKSS